MNYFRVLGYRLLGYNLRGSKIGFGTVLAVSDATLEACRIGFFNLFAGPMSITLRKGVAIGNANIFSCGYWTIKKENAQQNYRRSLVVEADALITSNHYFDVAGSFHLGERSWIAGIGSQFWTHGAGVHDRDISIGDDCYMGSAVRFAPGSSIKDHVIVAMGSVVAKKFDESFALIGGVPAAVLKTSHDWRKTE